MIEELDKKKWEAKEDLADRARRVLRDIWGLLRTTGGGPALLRDSVTIEVPIEDEPRHRTLDAIQEILDTCDHVRNMRSASVAGHRDTSLSLRGVGRGLQVIPMPEMYLRKRPPPGPTEGVGI